MPETNKMKVADLKRELKIRGLPTTGIKTELQERLQTALIDGELSLDDTAISGEDLLEDGVLTDEEDSNILETDENDLLQSPTIKETPTSLSLATSPTPAVDSVLEPLAKKVVLKRKNSFTTLASSVPISTTNTDASPSKVTKISERKPITMDSGSLAIKQNTPVAGKIELTSKERLELRAKKFGITTTDVKATTDAIKINNVTPIVKEQKIEILKKRAERFGCIVSKEIAVIAAEEKKLKRKERFGGEVKDSEWADKARMRLERFNLTPSATTKVRVTAPDLK